MKLIYLVFSTRRSRALSLRFASTLLLSSPLCSNYAAAPAESFLAVTWYSSVYSVDASTGSKIALSNPDMSFNDMAD